MKIIHLSDLHLGKKLFGYSLIEEQKDLLERIVKFARKEQVKAILIAGDLYDQPIPPYEAIELFHQFLRECMEAGIRVFCIAGNHDSANRLEFLPEILDRENLFIRSRFRGEVEYFDLENEQGKNVRIHLLPFIRPGSVQPYFEKPIDSYQEAFDTVMQEGLTLDPEALNILVAHQFISGAKTSESESRQIGGLDQIHPDELDCFDYCALGHLHRPQKVGKHIHYPGTLQKFGKDEVDQDKGFLLLDIQDDIDVRHVSMQPVHDLVLLEETFDELIKKAREERPDPLDYYWICLTDEQVIPDAYQRLSEWYPKTVRFEYANQMTPREESELKAVRSEDPLEIIQTFFTERSGHELNERQQELIAKTWEEILHETRNS